MASKKLTYISHPRMGLHHVPFPRPHLEALESPMRVQMIEKFLNTSGIFENVQKVKAQRGRIDDVLSVHSGYLLHTVELMSEIGSGQLGESAYSSPDLLRNALYAVGGALQAAKTVVSSDDTKHSFAAIRPPGHHASVSNPMGLCFFNNIAIAVRSILQRNDINKVTIFDFDDHHGNGTSEIFYSDPRVQYISVHEYDYESFGTGHYGEIGFGKGVGTNINIPLIDMAPDVVYEAAMDRLVVPAIEAFDPDIIAVSAGFDPHYTDPVGNMDIDSRTFWYIGCIIDRLVDNIQAKGSFWLLEGGYNLLALGPSVFASLQGLMAKPRPRLDDQIDRVEHQQLIAANEEVLDKVLETVSPFW